MAITPALFEILCFMLAFRQIGLDDLPPMKPRLSTRPTQDITVTCHLAASMDTHWFINSSLMQVVRNSTGQQDWAVLATLDLSDGKVSASDHLTQSADNFYVVNGTNHMNSWLNISLASVHDTSFCCQVVYLDNGSPKMWRSEAFPFPSNNKTYPVITVTVTEGMSLECFHKPQGTIVTETSLEIVKTETVRDLCPQLEDDLQRLCIFRGPFVNGSATKEAHIFNTTCQDDGRYQCRIFGVTSREMDIYLPGCSATTHQTTSVTNLITKMHSKLNELHDFIHRLAFGLGLPLIISGPLTVLGCVYLLEKITGQNIWTVLKRIRQSFAGAVSKTLDMSQDQRQDVRLVNADSRSSAPSWITLTSTTSLLLLLLLLLLFVSLIPTATLWYNNNNVHYHVLVNALSTHMIHINLNMIFYTHVLM